MSVGCRKEEKHRLDKSEKEIIRKNHETLSVRVQKFKVEEEDNDKISGPIQTIIKRSLGCC